MKLLSFCLYHIYFWQIFISYSISQFNKFWRKNVINLNFMRKLVKVQCLLHCQKWGHTSIWNIIIFKPFLNQEISLQLAVADKETSPWTKTAKINFDWKVSFMYLKFVFSKKVTKIDEIFTLDLTLTTKCQIADEDFINFCGLLKRHKLYCSIYDE